MGGGGSGNQYELDFDGDKDIDIDDYFLLRNAAKVVDLTGDGKVDAADLERATKISDLLLLEIHQDEVRRANVTRDNTYHFTDSRSWETLDGKLEKINIGGAAFSGEIEDLSGGVTLVQGHLKSEVTEGQVVKLGDKIYNVFKGAAPDDVAHYKNGTKLIYTSSNNYETPDAKNVIGATLGSGEEAAAGNFIFSDYDDDQSLILDLGKVRQIEKIVSIHSKPGEDRPVTSLAIEISADGTLWHQVASHSVINSNEVSSFIGSEPARYVRVNYGGRGSRVSELEIYETSGAKVYDGIRESPINLADKTVVLDGKTYRMVEDAVTGILTLVDNQPLASANVAIQEIELEALRYGITYDDFTNTYFFNDGTETVKSNPYSGKVRLRGLSYDITVLNAETHEVRLDRDYLQVTTTNASVSLGDKTYTATGIFLPMGMRGRKATRHRAPCISTTGFLR